MLLHNRYWWDSVSAESALSYLQTAWIWLMSCTKSVYTTYKRLLNVMEVSRAVETSTFPRIFLHSQSTLLMVSCGDSLEVPKPLAIVTFVAMFGSFGRRGRFGGWQCGGSSGEKILPTSENDLYVNLICKLYFCSWERGKLTLYQGKNP